MPNEQSSSQFVLSIKDIYIYMYMNVNVLSIPEKVGALQLLEYSSTGGSTCEKALESNVFAIYVQLINH